MQCREVYGQIPKSKKINPGVPVLKVSCMPCCKCLRMMFLMSQYGNFYRAPEIDISELENLFSAATTDSSGTSKGGARRSNISKPERVQLVSHMRFSFS